MNSGLQDAINLAWKLALVCHGHCNPSLLDNYEAERRPVAEAITASGDAVELAQTVTDPAERRARDDIDYGQSPIVMGAGHNALAPGRRLPDTIEVHLADGAVRMLHELANRAGHTALLTGGPSVQADALARVDQLMRAQRHASAVIEEVVVIGAGVGAQAPHGWITPIAAGQLGMDDVTVSVVRPDGHVAL